MADSTLELALKIRAAVYGSDAVKNLGNSFVTTNAQIETLIRGLTAISGSSDGAAKEFEYLAEQARKYGISILDLSDNYVKFIASSKGTALEGEAARKIFEATASTMAVLGGETVTTHRAFTALSQMMSKGQIYAEELKGQLAEAIPGSLQIMAKALGITTQEMLNLMKAGQLSSSALLPFAIQLEKQYGSLAASTTTFAQATNRLQTEWALLMKRIGDTGAWSVVTGAIELLGKNSEVLAGVIGAGLGLAFQKLVTIVGLYGVAAKESVVSISAQSGALAKLKTAIGWTTSANELAAKAANQKAIAERAAAAAAIESARISQQQAIATQQQAQLSVEAKKREIAVAKAKIAVVTEEDLANKKLITTKASEVAAHEKLAQSLEKERIAYKASLIAKAEGIAAAQKEVASITNSMLRNEALVISKEHVVNAIRAEVVAIESEIVALNTGVTEANLTASATAKVTTQKAILAEKILLEEAALNKASLAYARYSDVLKSRSFTNLIAQEQEMLKASIATTAATDAKRLKTQALLFTEKQQYTATLQHLGIKESEYALELRRIEVEQQAINQKRIRGVATEAEIALEKQLGIAREQLLIVGNKVAIADKNNEAAKARYMAQLRSHTALEQQLNVQVYSSLQASELKAAAEYKLALATEKRALRNKLAAQTAVTAAEQELVALTTVGASAERLAASEAVLIKTKETLTAKTNLLNASRNEQLALSTALTAANLRLADAGAFELEVSRMNLAQKELAAKQAANAVSKTEQQILVIERKVAALVAEGGSVRQVTILETELELLRDRSALATARQVIATNAVIEARIKESAVTGIANVAAKAYLATQTLLSRSWALLTGPTGMIMMMVAGFAYMFIAFREQDEATKNLSKSTEEYAKSLESMSAAQVIQSSNASKKMIDDTKERIDMLEKEIAFYSESNKAGVVRRFTWYTLGNMLSWLTSKEEISLAAQKDLADANAELSILEGKRAIAIESLGNKYAGLVSLQNSLVGSNSELIAKQQQQQAEVDRLNAIFFKSKEEVIALGIAQEALNVTTKQVTASNKALSNTSDLTKSALAALAEQTGSTELEIRAAIDGNMDYISSLDGKARAIVESIRRGIELGKLEAANEAQLKILNAEYKRFEGSVKAKTDATIKEAEALGDLETKRIAEIQGKRELITLAELGIKTVDREIDVINNQIALKKEEAIQNEKEADNINKNIVKLQTQREELLKTKATRESNMVVVKAEAIATEVAHNLISDSLIKNQGIIANSSTRIRELQTEYKNLGVTSETVFNKKQTDILEQIRIEQEKVAEAALTMGAAMRSAFTTLGLDYNEVITGMDFETKRMIDAFGVIGASGFAAASDIQKAFTDVLAKANTEVELEALKNKLIEVSKTGILSGDAVAQDLAAIGVKAAELRAEVDPLQIAMEKLGVGVPEKLAAAAAEAETFYLTIKKSKAPIDEIQQAFLSYAEKELLAAENGEKINLAQLKNEASALGLTNALNELINKTKESNAEFAGILNTYELLNNKLDLSSKYIEDNNAKVNAQIKASIDLAKEKGNLNVVAEKSYELIKEENRQLEESLQLKVEEKTLINEELIRINELVASDVKLTDAEEAQVAALKAKNSELGKEFVQIEASLPVKKREEEQALIMAGPIGKLTRLYEEQRKEHERTAASSERYQSALTNEAEHTLSLAEIKGDSAEIDRAQKALDDQKIQSAQAIANSKATAVKDAENELSAMTLKLAVDGELNQADQAQLATMAEKLAVMNQERDSMAQSLQATKDLIFG
jgi:tape measure domain-containing protein